MIRSRNSSVEARVIDQQARWAEAEGIPLEENGRTKTLKGNLFQELKGDSRLEFEKGAGRELEGDMRSLRSSSALVVNLFDHWREGDVSVIGSACGVEGVTKIQFEAKFETSLGGTAPHLDVFLSGGSKPVGIESKFIEPYGSPFKKAPFSPSYFEKDGLWDGLPVCERLARDLQDRKIQFLHLGAPQLIKHALGLQKGFGIRGFRLLYMWYDVGGPEAAVHREEIATFSRAVAGDLDFYTRTHQEVFSALGPHLEGHDPYRAYLRERYFSS